MEADETYFGQQENPEPSHKRKGRPYTKGGKSGPAGKRMVIALVERGGSVRAFHPARADGTSVNAIVRQNIARESRLHTDESRFYIGVGQEFRSARSGHSTRTANMFVATFTPTRLKASFQSSSAECAAFISTALRSICTDILPSSISVTTTALRSVQD